MFIIERDDKILDLDFRDLSLIGQSNLKSETVKWILKWKGTIITRVVCTLFRLYFPIGFISFDYVCVVLSELPLNVRHRSVLPFEAGPVPCCAALLTTYPSPSMEVLCPFLVIHPRMALTRLVVHYLSAGLSANEHEALFNTPWKLHSFF